MRYSFVPCCLLAPFAASCIIVPERVEDVDHARAGSHEAPFEAVEATAAPQQLRASASPATRAAEPEWVQLAVSGASAQPLPAATESLVIPAGEEPTLADLVGRWAELTQVEVLMDPQSEQLLSAVTASLTASRSVAPLDVQGFVQLQLARNSCYMVRIGGPDSRMVMAFSGTGRDAAGLRSKAAYVDAEDLSAFGDQHALLIQTVLDLPGLDTRQLTTSLRSLLTDTNTQNLISAGSNSVILQGSGAQVLETARTLARITRQTRAAAARTQPRD